MQEWKSEFLPVDVFVGVSVNERTQEAAVRVQIHHKIQIDVLQHQNSERLINNHALRCWDCRFSAAAPSSFRLLFPFSNVHVNSFFYLSGSAIRKFRAATLSISSAQSLPVVVAPGGGAWAVNKWCGLFEREVIHHVFPFFHLPNTHQRAGFRTSMWSSSAARVVKSAQPRYSPLNHFPSNCEVLWKITTEYILRIETILFPEKFVLQHMRKADALSIIVKFLKWKKRDRKIIWQKCCSEFLI